MGPLMDIVPLTTVVALEMLMVPVTNWLYGIVPTTDALIVAKTVAPEDVAATAKATTAGPGITHGNGMVVTELLVASREPGPHPEVINVDNAAAEL
jgi:hypothetical protein